MRLNGKRAIAFGYADLMSYLGEALQEPDEHENGPIERHHQRWRDQREENRQCHADRQQHLIVIPTADHRGRQVHYQVTPEERAQDHTLRVLRPIEYLPNIKTCLRINQKLKTYRTETIMVSV